MLAEIVGTEEKAQRVLAQMEKMSSRRIVFGPPGSGSSMAQIGMPFAEALVHGRRRWFLMKAEAYIKLKEKAGDDFQPGAAFSFFEDMYAELEEEFGMKASADAGLSSVTKAQAISSTCRLGLSARACPSVMP